MKNLNNHILTRALKKNQQRGIFGEKDILNDHEIVLETDNKEQSIHDGQRIQSHIERNIAFDRSLDLFNDNHDIPDMRALRISRSIAPSWKNYIIQKILSLTICIFLFSGVMNAQKILDDYVNQALKNNIVLTQKRISLEKASYAMKAARMLYFPNFEFNGSLTSGEGGRSINFPVGDLLNPVYSTLNSLTNSNSFPQISNVNENFFPKQFYDLKIRTSMPILNTDIIYNNDIKSAQVDIKDSEIEIYKKELIKEVKIAYYNFLSSKSAEIIYESALNLAREGKRINESLLNNGMNLKVYVQRSESEIQEILTKLNDTKNQSTNAKRYFNFLLNKELDSDISFENDLSDDFALQSLTVGKPSIERKKELQILQNVIDINRSIVKMNERYWVPKLNFFIDLGMQDEKFKNSGKSNYYLYGFQMNMNIFDFFKSNYKTGESESDLINSELEFNNVSKLLEMKALQAFDNFKFAKDNYQTSKKRFTAAKSYYTLIEKGYKEGQNTFIELMDARNQFTQSELQTNIKKFRILIEIANCERDFY